MMVLIYTLFAEITILGLISQRTLKEQPNGQRYPQVGGLGFCLRAEKT